MNNNTFDLLNVNLDGSHLLEAGAGTGKTYSLSFLYLRLLLEPIQLANPLKVDEIVVATFTNAATAELKERIYARLCEAENILLQLAHTEEVIGDETLITYLSNLQQNTDSLTLQRRLRLAQAQFDHAHIYSINAFALHLLSEHSITLGQPAPKDILDDDTQLIKNIYLQLAHNNFVEFGDSASAIGKTVADMGSDKLYGLLASMHNHYDKLKKAEQYFPDYQAAEQTFNEIAEELCSHTDDLRTAVDLLHTAIENKWLSTTIYKTDSLSVYTDKLFNRESYQPSDEKFLQFFSAQQLEKKLLKAGKTAGITFDNPVFTQFNQLIELSNIINKAESAEQYQHLMTLLSVIRTHLDNEKAKQMALTHDDIVRIVANGADKLHLPFKAALLDEAQDTNKNQLEIFKKLFLQRGHSCFFVGDPKQAIYGFRGGDVYTYLAMQQQVQHRHILPKNYRSTQAVNDCINTLFADNPFAQHSKKDTIDYHQIASDKDNQLSDFGDKSLTLVTADGTSADSLAETAADYLAHLLHSNIEITDKDERRPLQYGDIAVLVRSGSQAERMQQALAQRGITASYTGQNSVYASDEAVLMYALITAISESKTRQIKSLMLSPLFDYDTDNVLDDEIVNQLRQDFWDYANLYQQRGFAVMFYRLMHDYRIGGRLLQLTDGKRRLSNWIQLFELLQSALQNQSLTLLGLSEWLLRKINQHDKESQLRLEDQNAISIMTMHKSKGLEFKVVCLPFFNYHYEKGKSASDLLVSQQHELAVLNGLDIQTIKDLYQAEQQAEDMRLAYVALTRTTYHNIIVEQPIEKNKNGSDKKNATRTNSLWYRLLGDTPIAEQEFTQIIDEIPESKVNYTDNDTLPKVNILSLTKDLHPKWKMTSFSGLLQQMTAHSDTDSLAIKPNPNTDNNSSPSVLMQFPAGPKAGVLLHSLYEQYMENRCVDNRFIAYIDELLKQSRLPTNTDSQSLASAIADTAKIALHPQAFCLNDIDKAQQSIEMEFFIHLTPCQRQHLYNYFGQSIAPIVEGYLQGFIDYCFSYENKFYVLDYKSNKLGDSLADYHQDAMQNAMDEHRYDLQALIYTLALCKHLGIDNQADYEQLIGGYYYLFIRGMTDNANYPTDNGIYYRCVDWDLLMPLLADTDTE